MTKRLTTQQLEAIRKRAEAASVGPWYYVFANGINVISEIGAVLDDEVGVIRYPDAEFIAEAREDIPALLAEVERLTDELMKANDNIRGFADSEREITTDVERLRKENAMYEQAVAEDDATKERLHAEIERLRDILKGDGLLTLPDQVDHAREEIARLSQIYDDMMSIALWSARRLPKIHKDFAYDAIEANLGEEVERE